jgi:O-antigen ligase
MSQSEGRRTTGRSFEKLFDYLIRAPVIAGAFLISLVVSDVHDAFRPPKELLFRGEAIFAAAALLIALIYLPRLIARRASVVRPELLIVAAALVWTAISTAASTNRLISVESFWWVATAAVVFVAATITSRTWGPHAAWVVLLPAAVNALIVILQRLEVWSPIHFEQPLPLRIRLTGLIGNPNDLGSYLVAPLVLAVALSIVGSGRTRALCAAVAILLGSAMIATETLTAIAAAGLALTAMAMLVWRRFATRIVVAAATAAIVVFMVVAPLRTRAETMISAFRGGNYLLLTSNRIPAYMSAWALFKDHPLTGAGPGTFHWWYMPYKTDLNMRHPEMIDAEAENFGQVHNDHLELLAASGIVGYAIFLAALLRLGSLSLNRSAEESDFRESAARLTALPLSVAVFVMAIAQFPLELAAVLSTLLHTSALCVGWRRQ